MPGLLQGPHPTLMGVGVPDGGLIRPQKNEQNEKTDKNEKQNYFSDVTLVEVDERKRKTIKYQPPVRDMPGLLQGPHPTLMGVGVPDGGLIRPQKNKQRKNLK